METQIIPEFFRFEQGLGFRPVALRKTCKMEQIGCRTYRRLTYRDNALGGKRDIRLPNLADHGHRALDHVVNIKKCGIKTVFYFIIGAVKRTVFKRQEVVGCHDTASERLKIGGRHRKRTLISLTGLRTDRNTRFGNDKLRMVVGKNTLCEPFYLLSHLSSTPNCHSL